MSLERSGAILNLLTIAFRLITVGVFLGLTLFTMQSKVSASNMYVEAM